MSGSFNDWKEQVPLEKNGDNVFQAVIDLPKGEYVFKFIVDDNWIISKKLPTKVADDGVENNVVVVSG